MRLHHTHSVAASFLVLAAATAARADVAISSDATANMSCAGGVCQPTASDAVLNVGDLETLLAAGNVTVTTTGSGAQSNNIDVTANLGWSANALTLDAYQSLSVAAPIAVIGKSGLSILTNDGGSDGELSFSVKGHVTFKKLSGRLSINGARYKLVNSIASLASAIQKNPSGNYALASDYDAKNDGTYANSPITTVFDGGFEGLGHVISNLTINVRVTSAGEAVGLFSEILSGRLSDIGLANTTVKVFGHYKRFDCLAGLLVGDNRGLVSAVRSSGSISAERNCWVGGLIGINEGAIENSDTGVAVSGSLKSQEIGLAEGGLVGFDDGGTIEGSSASGNVIGTSRSSLGGLVGGGAYDTISDCHATGNIQGGFVTGGLAGEDGGVK